MTAEMSVTLPAMPGPAAASITVADVTQELQLVAENAEQMQLAQSQLAVWFRNKILSLQADLNEQQQELAIAEQNNWRTNSFKNQIAKIGKRIEFYEKCAQACEAGYCLVPNLPCDLFAVRTNRNAPRHKETTRQWEASEVRSESPAAGEGNYVDDKAFVGSEDILVNQGGKDVTRTEFFPVEFDGIDFPVSICNPVVMTATAKAMAMKVFDEIAIVDNNVAGGRVNAGRSASRSAKGDPLVIGIIRHPDRSKWNDKRLTFLIGWHIDTRTL